MHLTLLTIGSRGDVQPCIALGMGLQAAGHHVRLATHANFESFARERGLDFFPVEGNPGEILETEAGRDMLSSGRNPLRFIRELVRIMEPLMERLLADCWQACQGTDAILFGMFGFPGYHIAERLGIPSCAAFLQPTTRSRFFPNPAFPLRRGPGARPYHLLSHLFAEQLFWQPLRPSINRWREESLNLPPFPFWGFFGKLSRERFPILYGYSPLVFPRPADWGEWVQVTGYWFLDRPSDWQPPAGLVDFLESGPPPVYVGFGSMKNRDPEEVTALVLAALARAKRRGVLVTGQGGLSQADLPDEVFMADAVPHDWLFPRMAAVVHHGGAGTTAAGLRAGVPSVVVPFFGDQPFWAGRVAALGVGPRPIPRKRLSVERLAAAITAATEDEAMRQRVAALGERIRAEDGVARAVETIHAGVLTGL